MLASLVHDMLTTAWCSCQDMLESLVFVAGYACGHMLSSLVFVPKIHVMVSPVLLPRPSGQSSVCAKTCGRPSAWDQPGVRASMPRHAGQHGVGEDKDGGRPAWCACHNMLASLVFVGTNARLVGC